MTDADIGKQVTELHYRDNWDWSEIADHLDLPKENVRSASRRYIKRHGLDLEEVKPQVNVSKGANKMTAVAQGTRITTPQQLEESLDIDPNIWALTNQEVKKWEVQAKQTSKHLEYNDGRATGTIDTEGPEIQQLISIRCSWVKRKPTPIYPVFDEIKVDTPFRYPEPPEHNADSTTLVIADSHVGFNRDIQTAKLTPFHDRSCWDTIFHLIPLVKPDRISIIGDLFDLPQWNDKFLKSPEFFWTTRPAILEMHLLLRRLRQLAPDAVINAHQGNHDERLSRGIITAQPAAYDLQQVDAKYPVWSISHLLKLSELGINWIEDYPNDWEWLSPLCRLNHGNKARSDPGDTAKAVIKNSTSSVMFAHIHREEKAAGVAHSHEGDYPIYGVCPGCVCRTDHIVPGHKKGQIWTKGIGIVRIVDDWPVLSTLPIHEGRTIFEGQVIESSGSYYADLKDTYPDWNW